MEFNDSFENGKLHWIIILVYGKDWIVITIILNGSIWKWKVVLNVWNGLGILNWMYGKFEIILNGFCNFYGKCMNGKYKIAKIVNGRHVLDGLWKDYLKIEYGLNAPTNEKMG